jgi:hypothetical protein
MTGAAPQPDGRLLASAEALRPLLIEYLKVHSPLLQSATEFDALRAEMQPIAGAIARAPARSIDGVLAKTMAALWSTLPDGSERGVHVASLLERCLDAPHINAPIETDLSNRAPMLGADDWSGYSIRQRARGFGPALGFVDA